MFLLLVKKVAEASSWPIMSVFGYETSPYPQVLCGEMSGVKTTAIATQNGQASLAVFGLNFGHAPKAHLLAVGSGTGVSASVRR